MGLLDFAYYNISLSNGRGAVNYSYAYNNNLLTVFNNSYKYSSNGGLDTFVRNSGISTINHYEKSSVKQINSKDFGFTTTLTNAQKSELSEIKSIYNQNKSRYENISHKIKQKTGVEVPPELIAAIHYRESNCNFNTYLHNGEKLGQTTTKVPVGIYFDNFEDAAVDAICRVGVDNIKSGNPKSYLEFAERFNGLGYRNKGVASPYVWSGTDKYKGGMYVADHQYSPTAKDRRCGVAIILNELAA